MPVVYCARPGCGHRQNRHQGGTGECCVKPTGHCLAFLSEVTPPPTPSGQSIAVQVGAETDQAGAVTPLLGDVPVPPTPPVVVVVDPVAESDGAGAVAPVLSPTPPVDLRPVHKGAFTRDGYPPNGSVITPTIKIEWSTIEQTQGVRNRSAIQNLIDTAVSRGFPGIRLRIAMGAFAPGWAKSLGTGPIPYTEPQNNISATVPDIWSTAYQNAVANFYAWLAAEFDADPRLLLVFASGASLYYAEPFIRGTSNATNRSNFLAHGYTIAKDQAIEEAQLDYMNGFTKTPVGLAYNPWQYIKLDGKAGTDLSFTETVIDYHIAQYGDATILQNNSIRESYVASVPALYGLFIARRGTVNTQYQVAGANQITCCGHSLATSFNNTMEWAINYLEATGVELVNGFTNCSTPTQWADWDSRLIANGVGLP